MLVSGGKVIAIDYIKTNSATLSGDGVWTELGLNTSATIDPINNNISAVSSKVNTISGNVTTISGKVDTISSDLIESSGKVDELSGNFETLSSKLDDTSAKLDNEIQERKDDVSALKDNISSLSSVIDEHTNYIETLSSDVDYLSAELDAETSARIEDVLAIQKDIDKLSADLDEEISARIEADDNIISALDTKQHRLSAGEFIEITSGEDYDTISVTGLKSFTYFATPYNRHTSTDYFTFDGTKLSANSSIGYFNLAINYKVNTNNTCVDNYYSAGIKINDVDVDTHFINGDMPFETHTFSKNVLNDAEDNLYEIGINKDTGIDVNDINITCVGFMGEPDMTNIGVLGANGGILTFGNTILRV